MNSVGGVRTAVVAMFALVLTASGAAALGQTSANTTKPSQTTGSRKAPVTHRRSAKSKKAAQEAKAAEVAAQPVPEPPPMPKWPANEQAVPAKVGWNGHQLEIAATNSSLLQIIRDVSSQTGVKVEGLTGDQRIFGSYGPADPRDVLAKLLEGSGYNVLMIGDQGAGTPREVVLTAQARNGASPAPNQAGQGQPGGNGDDEQPEDQEQPEQQPIPPPRQPFGGPPQQQPPGSGRTPQQLIQELQQRQQQMQQQQQQQQPDPQSALPPDNQIDSSPVP